MGGAATITVQDSLAHYRLVGVDAPTVKRVIERVERGLPFTTVERLQKLIGARSLREVADLLAMSERTLYLRKDAKRLSPEESDRLLRVTRIIGLAFDLFEGNRAGARQWLSTPKPQLEGASPIESMRTAVGSHAVEELIWRAEHSIYS